MRRASITVILAGALALISLGLPAAAAALLGPTVTLDSPGSAPLLTPTPTLSGTAGTDPGDSGSVSVLVYTGTDTSQQPVRSLTTFPAGDGSFSVQVSPALSDGQYTAVAEQASVAGTGTSAPQTFRIKANAPAVTLEQPASAATTAEAQPQFGGAAGDALGDGAEVTLTLYAGDTADGEPVGSVTVARSGPTWSARWPTPLAAGSYTAQATQGDDVGHIGLSAPHTFEVVFPRGAIGSTVRLSRGGSFSVPVTCSALAGQTCSGSVLVLSVAKFRPVRGGPSGRLRILFVHVAIPAGQTETVSGGLERPVLRALRRAGGARLRVVATFAVAGGPPSTTSALRRLARGSGTHR